MIEFPNAKINLGLNVTRKSEDGFHEIESVFYPVNWRDSLEISPREDKTLNFKAEGMERLPNFESNDLVTKDEFLASGDPEEGPTPPNLVEKAYALMQKHYDIPGADIILKKDIPMGAGLGGGSSDAAFTLKMVNKLYDLNLSNEKLEEHAATLGSDCPFFIQNRPMYVTGKGEKMQPLDLKLNGFYMVLVYPGFHVSTKWAYSKIVPKPVEADMLMVIKQDFPQWKKHLKNDFQPLVIKERDYLLRVIELLNNNGSMYTAMTGSGSTVYGIFSEFPEGIQFHPEDTHVTLPL